VIHEKASTPAPRVGGARRRLKRRRRAEFCDHEGDHPPTGGLPVAAYDHGVWRTVIIDVRLQTRQRPFQDRLRRLQVGLIAEDDLLVRESLPRRYVAEMEIREVKNPSDVAKLS